MSSVAAFLEEIDALARIQADLEQISTRTDDRRKYEMVELRRKLSQQIALVGRLGEPMFASADDKEAARIYRSKFSTMRSSTAMHQAEWPAVRLGESVAAHHASALGVRDANHDFISWVRAAIATTS